MRIRIGDILIALVVAAAAVLLLVLPSRQTGGALTAVIIVDEKEHARVALHDTADPIEIDLHELGVVITAQDGQIWFAASSCADQTCVNTGKLAHAGDIAVCLPNQVIVKIEGEKSGDVDVVAE